MSRIGLSRIDVARTRDPLAPPQGGAIGGPAKEKRADRNHAIGAPNRRRYFSACSLS
jgi:hypothetical protein